MTTKKKTATKNSFELTFLVSVQVGMKDAIELKKLEERMKAKEKSVINKVDHVRITVNEDGILMSKPLWWAPDKMHNLTYDQLKNVYTFDKDPKRICIDIADHNKNNRRIILFKMRNPVELVILVEMLQKRKMYSRLYEKDNVYQVQYGQWISGYAHGNSPGYQPEEFVDNEVIYPERDYPQQMDEDKELMRDDNLKYDYYGMDASIEYIRNDVQIFIPGYNGKLGSIQRPGMYPSQWGKDGQKSRPSDSQKCMYGNMGKNLTMGGIEDGYISNPGANLVVCCITLFKYHYPPKTKEKAPSHPPKNIRYILRTISPNTETDERLVLQLRPISKPTDEIMGGKTLPMQNMPILPAITSTHWIYFKPEPMNLAKMDVRGSRHVNVTTR